MIIYAELQLSSGDLNKIQGPTTSKRMYLWSYNGVRNENFLASVASEVKFIY